MKYNLQPLDAFIVKVIQLYEMIVVRHGLMLVGQSFGMKTAAYRVLADALTDLKEKVGAHLTLHLWHVPSDLDKKVGADFTVLYVHSNTGPTRCQHTSSLICCWVGLSVPSKPCACTCAASQAALEAYSDAEEGCALPGSGLKASHLPEPAPAAPAQQSRLLCCLRHCAETSALAHWYGPL